MQPCWTPIHSLPCNAGRAWNRIKSTRTDKFPERANLPCKTRLHSWPNSTLRRKRQYGGLIMSRDSWPHQPAAVCVYSLQLSIRLLGSFVLTLETLVCSPQQQGTSMIWWLIPLNKRQLRHATWMHLILSKSGTICTSLRCQWDHGLGAFQANKAVTWWKYWIASAVSLILTINRCIVWNVGLNTLNLWICSI